MYTKWGQHSQIVKHWRRNCLLLIVIGILVTVAVGLSACAKPQAEPPTTPPPAAPPPTETPLDYWFTTEPVLLNKGEVIDIAVESGIYVECSRRSPGTVYFGVDAEFITAGSAQGYRGTTYDYDELHIALDHVDEPTFIHYLPWGSILYEGRPSEKSGEKSYVTAVRFIAEEAGYHSLYIKNYKPKSVQVTYRIYEIGRIDYDEWESEWLDYFYKYIDVPEQPPYEPLPPVLQRPPTGGYPATLEEIITLGPYR